MKWELVPTLPALPTLSTDLDQAVVEVIRVDDLQQGSLWCAEIDLGGLTAVVVEE